MKRVFSLFLSVIMTFCAVTSVDLSVCAISSEEVAEVLLKENIQYFKEYFLSDLDPTKQAFYIDHLSEMNHKDDEVFFQVLQDSVNRVQKKWSQIFQYMPDSISDSQVVTMGNKALSYLNGTIEVFKNIEYLTTEDTRITQKFYHGLHAVNTALNLIGVSLGPVSTALRYLEKFFIFSDIMYVTFMDQMVEIQVKNYSMNLYIEYWGGQDFTPPNEADVAALNWSNEWVENYMEGAYEQFLLYISKRMKDNVQNMTVTEPIAEKGYYNGHTYWCFEYKFSTVEEAEAYCESLGGHLAIIETAGEDEAVYTYLRNCGQMSAFLGMVEHEEGEWFDIFGNPLSYFNWAPNEPNNAGVNEDIINYWRDYPDGKWNDSKIGKEKDKHYICEWDTYITPYPTVNEEHSYSTSVVAATCTTDGYTINKCSDCGLEYYSNYISKTGHNYVFTQNIECTCTAQGYDLYSCKNCKSTEKKNIVSATGHRYTFKENVSASCVEDGYELYACLNCGLTEKRNTVCATGHSYEITTVPATCTQKGLKISVCSICGDKQEEDISALGHSYKKEYNAPTCTESNGYTHTCTRCGYVTCDFYPARGHDYGEVAGKEYVQRIAGTTISSSADYYNEFYHTSTSIGSKSISSMFSTNVAVPNEIRLNINDMEAVIAYDFYIKAGLLSSYRYTCEYIFAYNPDTGREVEQSAIPYTDKDGNLVNMNYIDYKVNDGWINGQFTVKNEGIVDLNGNVVCNDFLEIRPHIVFTKTEAIENGIMNSDGTVNVTAELSEDISFSTGIPGIYFKTANIVPTKTREAVSVFGFDENCCELISGGKYDVNICFYNKESSGLTKTTFKIYDGTLIKKIPATFTEDEIIEYTCIDCGEIKTERCSIDLADYRIAAASVSLANNIRMNYKVLKTTLAEFEDFYIQVIQNGKKTKITEYFEQGDYYVFVYKNIAPQCMGDTLTAVLYGTHNGLLYSSDSLEFGVKEYIYRMLEVCESDNYLSLRRLLVDMLNYGAAAQVYMNYNTDRLVNTELTEKQKSWATDTESKFTDISNPNYKEVENADVVWCGVGLVLYDSIYVRYTFKANNIDGLVFKISCNEQIWTYDKDNITVNDNGTYSILFTDLNADKMSDEIYITAYNSDMEVSNTLLYSVESYAASVQNSMPNTALENLTNAMIKYGASAKNYSR